MRPMNLALSGIDAATTQLASSASNVANVETPGYAPSRVDAQDRADGGVRVTISREAFDKASAAAGQSGTDLVTETVNRSAALAAYRANLRVIGAADDAAKAVASLGRRSPR